MSTGRRGRAAIALLSEIVRLLLAPTLILGSGNADAVVAAPPLDATHTLHAAIEASDRNDLKNAADDIEAVVDDPAFGALDDSTRHFAFELAVQIFRNVNEPVKAQRFAVLATEGPEQNLDDWKSRLSIDLPLKLVRDEAECVTTLERRWGGMAGIIADDTILRVFAETGHTDLEDVRLPMLEDAEGVGELCNTAGDYTSALKFAQVWQKHAWTDADRASADVTIARLKTFIERQQLTEAAAPGRVPPGKRPSN